MNMFEYDFLYIKERPNYSVLFPVLYQPEASASQATVFRNHQILLLYCVVFINYLVFWQKNYPVTHNSRRAHLSVMVSGPQLEGFKGWSLEPSPGILTHVSGG